MATRMLIDARHPEETRVAVLKGNRIEEFDFESAEHKQIKGNIYLAKVTRVEPSLQAAFVDFGGNRHGFLAFSEIHPDYYQIPSEDRARLLAEEQAAADEEAALRAEEDDDEDGYSDEDYRGDDHDDDDDDDDHDGVEEIDTSEKDEVATIEDGQVANGDDDSDENGDDEIDGDNDAGSEDDSDEETGDANGRSRGGRGRGGDRGRGGRGRPQGRRQGGGSNRAKEIDDVRAKRQALRRRYKIQDVIQRRQVLLVQVVKEERGNKGAALTTYLSLAGRYCVLMPNSSHGGGISRKISSGSDRKRLKQIVNELTLPKSMGLIVRTAGLQRNKTEIKRDFDYLARLWDEIRERTLSSSAPAAIHSDSDLIKRAIRDIYNREIEEVVVEGAEGYRAARDFMKLLMPSHVRRVKAYSDPVPLFQRYGAEDQLSAMYDPVVQLKSGGYLVINPTEALVSIDINSGRSTKEHGIEATALNTNLEAAREIARQLRLRDMAGLVVIDFIDMEHSGNTRKVERCMKDSLKNDRARIQVGRISGFGLMEMSRQRLRTGVLEATTRQCPHCDGTGLVRTASSAGLSALRLIEDEAAKGKGTVITLYASTEAAVYLLNAKRADLAEIEHRYHVMVQVVPEGENEGAKMRVASSGPRPTEMPAFEPIALEVEDLEDYPEEDEEEEEFEADRSEDDSDRESGRERGRGRGRSRGGRGRSRDSSRDVAPASDTDREEEAREVPREGETEEEADARRKRRRRRRGGRGRGRDRDENGAEQAEGAEGNAAEGEEAGSDDISDDREPREGEDAENGEGRPKRRRRGGRGRGRRRDEAGNEAESDGSDEQTASDEAAEEAAPVEAAAEPAPVEPEVAEKPKRTRRKKADAVEAAPEEVAAEVAAPEAAEEAPAKPARRSRKKAETVEAPAAAPAPADVPAVTDAPEEAAKPKRAPRRKKAEAAGDTPAPEPAPAAEPAPEAAAEPANDANGETEAGSQPRRGGWWQRTFGQ
ncbi:ribonuclease E/G [Altererythrobacter sp. KTW20L]|uniref:Rne/Rng family ribonuclease n=1 Tax=Altererythrobacter sp. KTW20L TaxID=2942210 RepID=UPI0020BF5758|nr:ribonuclease E/G [Altererythrobacter sp. KTW20L]MCL6251891.1 ribonuclease E/G [Altererythrobacter sp. KTW20L]